MDWFKLIYTLLGGLAIFFFGMKHLSDGLQSAGTDVLKKAIGYCTTNRFLAVLVGLLVTGIVQSSSITTVTIVSMVNAGLMNLTQAIGVIFGANIGTTFTAWIFTLKIGGYGLLMIGVGGLGSLFISQRILKNIFKIILALGFVFYGLQLMGDAFKPLQSHDSFIFYMKLFDANVGIGNIIACVFTGCVLTMIVQSSSAMMAITISLYATTGCISFETACALVIGENIGTTITALLACVGGTTNAKRTALAHSTFNVVGACLAMIFFPFLIKIVMIAVNFFHPKVENVGAQYIAMFHSLFNVIMTILFLPFVNQLAYFVTKLIPESATKEHHKLAYNSPDRYISPELGIDEVVLSLLKMSGLVRTALVWSLEYVHSEQPLEELKMKIKKYETITDYIKIEVRKYLSKMMCSSLDEIQSMKVYSLIRISDELESLADYCTAMVRARERLAKEDFHWGDDFKKLVDDVGAELLSFFEKTVDTLDPSKPDILTLEEAYRRRDSIKQGSEKVRQMHIDEVKAGRLSPHMAIAVSDLMISMRKMKRHMGSLTHALLALKK